MKLPHLCAIVLLVTCTVARADWQIIQTGQHKGRGEEITISIRDSLVRYDRPERNLSWLTDVSTGDTILLVDTAKRYQRYTAPEVVKNRENQRVQATAEMQQQSEKARAVTGEKSETVAGFKTTQYVWTHPAGISMKLWVATTPEAAKLGEILQKAEDANPLSSPLLPGTPRHGDFKGLIVRYEMSTSKGSTSTNAVVSVKEQKLEGKLFEIPADYRELKK